MKIVFLDAKTIGQDICLAAFSALGQVVIYPFSTTDQAAVRVTDADVIVTNKMNMNEQTLHAASHLKLVCVTATGTNNLDKEYLAKRNITWRNVADYSTESVTQHTFAMLFFLLEKLNYYDQYVKSGRYQNDTDFSHYAESFCELKGKTWGIIGLGNIGRRVTQIAQAFGAHVIYYSPSGAPAQEGFRQVDLDTLLATSDIVSVHAPLNAFTENLMDAAAFQKMQPHAIFLNLGRGPIVVEEALAAALINHQIAAAGLDVLAVEPMSECNPLASIQDSRRLLITPHIGWASIESRTRLMAIIAKQIETFFSSL